MIAAAVGRAKALRLSRGPGHSVRASVALAVAALALQTFLPTVLSPSSLLNLPLLVAIYLMLMSRSALAAMAIGVLIGWAQDGLTHGPVGTYGIVYAILGFLSASVSRVLQLNLFYVLGLFVALAYLAHEVLLYAVNAYLLVQRPEFEPGLWFALTAFHAGVGMLVFPLFDRLVGRK